MDSIKLADLRRHYQNEPLDLHHLEPDPFLQFTRWFEAAAKAEEVEPNAMALATADADGRPSLRMVLLKGMESGGMVFYTNYLSRKGHDLEQNPHAALLFWWQTLERQVRIEGVIHRVDPTVSDAYFQSRPIGSQMGAIVSPQSKPISDYSELANGFEKVQAEYQEKQHLSRPDHWGGYVLKPTCFEFWQGRENRLHDRFRFAMGEDRQWHIQRLAP
jgi:pyridoxamine 5'-phosphate oxidase